METSRLPKPDNVIFGEIQVLLAHPSFRAPYSRPQREKPLSRAVHGV